MIQPDAAQRTTLAWIYSIHKLGSKKWAPAWKNKISLKKKQARKLSIHKQYGQLTMRRRMHQQVKQPAIPGPSSRLTEMLNGGVEAAVAPC